MGLHGGFLVPHIGPALPARQAARQSRPDAKPNVRGRGFLVAFLIVVVAVALYAAAGFLIAPRMVERKLVALADERLGDQLTIEKIRINPFTLSIEILGLQLAERNQPALLAARRLYFNLSLLSSGFGRGWVLSEAQSDGMQVLLEQRKNGRLNLEDLMQRWQDHSPAPKTNTGPPPRFTVRHLLASDGKLTYREVSDRPAATQIVPIRIELENLSTVPDREGRYTVSARFIDGGALSWHGDLTLQPLESEGDVDLQGLKLATAWQFFRDVVRLDEPRGQISVASHYRFTFTDNKPVLALSKLRLDASELNLARDGSHEPMLLLKKLEARDGTFDFTRRSLVIPMVVLTDGSLRVLKDGKGALNWALARTAGSPDTAPDAAAPESVKGRPVASAWNFELREIKLDRVALRYTDLQRPAPLDMQAQSVQGKAALNVVAGTALELQAHDIDLHLQKLRMPLDTPTVQLNEVKLQGGFLDLARHRYGAKEIVANGGTLRLERGPDGTLAIASTFASNADASAQQGPPWNYAIDLARVQGLDVALSDRSFGQPIAYPISGLSARVQNVASAGTKPIAFNASGRLGNGGSIAANGSVATNFSHADAEVKLTAVQLSPLQPLITRYAAVDLVSGTASLSAAVAYKQNGGRRSLSAKGPFELDNIRLNEAGTDTSVLAWKRLSTPEARVTLGPDAVRIKEMVAEAPQIRVEISEEHGLNLAKLLKQQPSPPPATPKTQEQDKQAEFSIRIGELRLRDGTIDYSDHSLVLPFATPITNFEGTAAGLGTGRDRIATLQFAGEIGEFGSAQISGRIDAFAPKTFTDVTAKFENVEMPKLSPYSATFLGRTIASGKLWVNTSLRVNNGELTGGTDVTVHELALGEAVDTPTALKLPLDLAVALLTDSQGVIHTAVPVHGNVNDPKFDIGTVIREAVSDLIKKIVSAPFRALAGLFGGGKKGEDVAAINFDPGSAKLMPSEKEKIENVAKAMDERPQLRLVVQAPYEPDADRRAIQQEQMQREVALALGRTLQPDEKPAVVAFENLATQRALEKLAVKKTDAATVRNWVTQYARKKGSDPKRAGMVLRTTGDPDFYRAMFDWLESKEPVPDAAVQQLAQNRAKSVIEALRSSGVDENRLETAPVKSVSQDQDERIRAALSVEPAQVHGAAPTPERREVAAQAR